MVGTLSSIPLAVLGIINWARSNQSKPDKMDPKMKKTQHENLKTDGTTNERKSSMVAKVKPSLNLANFVKTQ